MAVSLVPSCPSSFMVTTPFSSTMDVPSLKATDFRALLSTMGASCTLALLEPNSLCAKDLGGVRCADMGNLHRSP
jgi:hypothetical protein